MLYEVTLSGSYYNQTTINRFSYVSSGEGAGSLVSMLLVKAMGFIPDNLIYPSGTVFNGLRSIVSNQWTAVSVIARAASDYAPVDFYERPFITPAVGFRDESQGLSPVLSIGYRSSRVRTDIDRGTKRFAGVTENQVDGGGVINAGSLAPVIALAELLGDVLTINDEGNTVSFSPCVVSKEPHVLPNGNTTYRYYPTLAEQMEHVALGVEWQHYPQVRTQNSRQYGRGV